MCLIVREITSECVVLDAPAKVNLFLEVLNRREDGFHDINSCFQAVSLYDRVTVSRSDSPGVAMEVDSPWPVPTGPENLAHRAATALLNQAGLQSGLLLRLQKRIPTEAGLAGGSADAAAVLSGVNLLCGLKLSTTELATIGAGLGSDVPFFFSSGQALVQGRGERIEDTELPLDYRFVLVKPKVSIPTGEAYRQLKRGLTNSKSPFSLRRCGTFSELVVQLRDTGNDFEETAIAQCTQLDDARRWLSEQGAALVRMTGSGSTVFGLFPEVVRVRPKSDELPQDWFVQIADPVRLPEI